MSAPPINHPLEAAGNHAMARLGTPPTSRLVVLDTPTEKAFADALAG